MKVPRVNVKYRVSLATGKSRFQSWYSAQRFQTITSELCMKASCISFTYLVSGWRDGELSSWKRRRPTTGSHER